MGGYQSPLTRRMLIGSFFIIFFLWMFASICFLIPQVMLLPLVPLVVYAMYSLFTNMLMFAYLVFLAIYMATLLGKSFLYLLDTAFLYLTCA